MKLVLNKEELKNMKGVDVEMHTQELMDDAYEGTISKSKMIQEMFKMGMSVQEIHKKTNIRYAMVYNIVTNYINKNGLLERVEKTTRGDGGKLKEDVLRMKAEGKTIADISRDLGKAYPQVWKICKDAGLAGKDSNASTVDAEVANNA